PELRRFFARLSVFRGGWTLEAAEAVCTGVEVLGCWGLEGELDVRRPTTVQSEHPVPQHLNTSTPQRPVPELLDALERLRDASLIVVEERAGEARYGMLETLREYAAEQLVLSGEQATVRERHRDWCLRLATQF